MSAHPLIRLKGLRKIYRMGPSEVRALDGVDLTIEQREFVSVMGPSGSGKSTLMQIVGLLDDPSQGRYELDGKDVSRIDEDTRAFWRARKIGFVFQFFNLLGRATATENVELPLIYAGASDRDKRVAAALKSVGLSDRAKHTPAQLSGGQQQRVAIARAIVGRPLLILADEPTGNVSSEQSKDVMAHLQALNDSGITILLVTHEADIAAYAHREIRMRDGRIESDVRKKGAPRSSGSAAGEAALPPRVSGALRPTQGVGVSDSDPAKSSGRPAAAVARDRSGIIARLEENIEMAIDALLGHKLRSFLAALGIVIGVGAIIAMLAIGAGARFAMRERISAMGANLLYVYPQRGSRRILKERGSFTRLTLDDAKAVEGLSKRGIPIVRATPTVRTGVRLIHGDLNWDSRLTGALPKYSKMHNAEVVWGRFFSPQENASRSRVLVIGSTVVENLFEEGEDPVGQSVRLGPDYFKIIGVLKSRGGSSWRDRDDEVIAPLQTVMRRVLGVDYVHSIEVEVESPEVSEGVTEEVLSLLRRRHNLPPHREDDIRVFDMAEIQETMSATTKTISTLLGAIAAISLLVGGVGIMNIMLVSVKERTREIGLRKAVGARSSDIMVQFLIEAAVITVTGGCVGISIGVGIAFGVAKFAGRPVIVWPASI